MVELKVSGLNKFNYCPYCGSKEIEHKKLEGHDRMVCQGCERVLYRNPIPSVVGISILNESEILLVKRGVEPDIGSWCLPGGFMELGETSEEAVMRELKEETGIDVKPLDIITVDTSINGFYGDVVVIAYKIDINGNTNFRAGDDALEVKYYSFENLPRLTFKSHEKIIKKAFKELGHPDYNAA